MLDVELQDLDGSPFGLEGVAVAATTREWRCRQLPSGGGLRVSLTDFQCSEVRRHGIDPTDPVVTRAIGLAVAEALRHPLPAGSPGRHVDVTSDHLRRAG